MPLHEAVRLQREQVSSGTMGVHPDEHLDGRAAELAQRRLAAPHALVDHFAQRQRAVGQPRPTALEAQLEQAAHQAAGALGDVHHVRRQRQPVQLQPRDIRLGQGAVEGEADMVW